MKISREKIATRFTFTRALLSSFARGFTSGSRKKREKRKSRGESTSEEEHEETEEKEREDSSRVLR